MSWTAIVPLNLGRDRKTRLAGRLSLEARHELVDAMARRVIAQLAVAECVGRIVVLSPEAPHFAGVDWIADKGAGLNAELARVLSGGPAIIVHADLPLLGVADIDALAGAAGAGVAIAPDRASSGTNALALAESTGVIPRFGPDSFALHRALFPGAAIVSRPGLAIDIDTPGDLDFALAQGAASIACPI